MEAMAKTMLGKAAALGAAVVALVLALGAGAGSAWALEHPVPDASATGSVSFSLVSKSGKAEAGAKLSLYKVANVASDDGDFVWELSAAFADSGADVSAIDAPETAADLARAASGKKADAVVTTDANGAAKAAGLPVGAYVVVQEQALEGFVRLVPFVFTIPSYVEGEDVPEGYGEYVYDVQAEPKVLPVGEVAASDEDVVDEGRTNVLGDEGEEGADARLPQTGQLWWPVPLLLVAGAVFLVLGRRRSAKAGK